ncbi:hypothetical protein ACQUWM_06230 [Marinobacter sp. DUT-3]|uniref:hypothetical protein n=1 Tax=unclassified Marinobacter TaxID=83889 RepID=UPI00387ACF8D
MDLSLGTPGIGVADEGAVGLTQSQPHPQTAEFLGIDIAKPWAEIGQNNQA